MLVAAKRKPKIERKWWKPRKPVLMEDTGNLRLQILQEFKNMESLSLTKVKSFQNEVLQSCVKHSPSKQVNHDFDQWNIGEVYKPTRRANTVSNGTT